MRGNRAVVLLVILAACSSTPTAATPTPSPTSRASAPTATSSPLPPATPLASAPPATLPTIPPSFTCRIPVYDPNGLHDSFIAFPKGIATPAATGGYYFDIKVGRWLPVGRNSVSPDGLRYAYAEGWSVTPAVAPRVHIIDASNDRAIRVVTMPAAQPYVVADFAADGVYMISAYEGCTAPGVWRVDPDTGSIAKVSDGNYVPAGATWISEIDPRDPNPPRSAESGQAEPNRIDYRDASGRTSMWFYRPGYALAWVAFARRSEILVQAWTGTGDQKLEYWLVIAAGHATPLASGPLVDSNPYSDPFGGFFSAISDFHGIWIGGGQGLYLVSPTGLFTRAYGAAAYPANGCF